MFTDVKPLKQYAQHKSGNENTDGDKGIFHYLVLSHRHTPFHDLFYYDRKEYNSQRERGQLSHSRMHSLIAVRNAEQITDITPLERDIIEKHMFPMTIKLPKYRESYVITLIDKYCAILEVCVPKIYGVIPNHKN